MVCVTCGLEVNEIPEVHRCVEALLRHLRKVEACVMPTKGDLEWLSKSIQRHTGGIKEWWIQNRINFDFKGMAEMIIAVWEAGRGKAENLPK